MTALPRFFADYQRRVTTELERLIGRDGGPVERAMAYTALAPSKQVRAVLVLSSAELCRGEIDRAVPAAAAIELVHSAGSLEYDPDDVPTPTATSPQSVVLPRLTTRRLPS